MPAKVKPKEGRLDGRMAGEVKRADGSRLAARTHEAGRARRVISGSEILELSEHDQLAFALALQDPPSAPRALRVAARRYRDVNWRS